jgi:SAM-dependent methyltransferase
VNPERRTERGADLAAGSRPVPQEVRRYYRGKTAAILDRYGPGPRVHYHIGLFVSPGAPPGPADEIRAEIVTAQERLLERAAEVFDAGAAFTGDLLDVGCGLGGGAIYWAQRFGVTVTALTNVPEHAELISVFAARAGVGDRVRPVVGDAAELAVTGRYRAAVAVESSCYLPRERLFRRIAAVLEPGGVFGIEDIFLARPAWGPLFDAYWKTAIGTVAQYRQAARDAGLSLEQDTDVTEVTGDFWRYSVAWARARLATPGISAAERERLLCSIEGHDRFSRGWRAGAYQARILRFRKRG